MKYRKYTKQEYDNVMELRRKHGYGYKKISNITGLPRGTLMGWIHLDKKPYDAWTKEDYDKRHEKLFTEKNRENMRKAQLGRKHPPKVIEKMRRSKLGPLNPMWKGNDVPPDMSRRRARRMYKTPIGKEIHHIDGDPYNNEPENIDFVSRIDHMEKDGRLERLIERNKLGHSPETRVKLSAKRKGTKHRPESIEKMSLAHKGKYPNDETRKRMSEARKRYWENRRQKH